MEGYAMNRILTGDCGGIATEELVQVELKK